MRSLAPIALASLVFATAASASITSTSGDAQEAFAASVKPGANESDTAMTTFDERQCVLLSQPLQVDITRRAVVNRRHKLTPGVVAAGVSVSSHFVHVDPVGRKLITLTGRLTTDERILGVIVTRQRLDASDFLGAAGTSYPTNAIGRQMEPGNDAVDISDDRHSVRIKSTAGLQFDQLRVITRCGDTTEDPARSRGCTAGFWRQQPVDSWPAYSSTDRFEAVFGVDAFIGDPSLADALRKGGGSMRALARQAVAALLNASSPDIDYELTSAEVIALTAAAFKGNARSVAHLQDRLERLNSRSCHLG